MFNCCIWDIKDLADNKVIIDLEISNDDNVIDNYEFELDLNKMGLKQDDEFAVELYKDIRRFINKYYEENNKIPTSEEIKNAVEVNWLETKLWIEYKNGVQAYLKYCVDNGITKEYLDKKFGCDTPNIMKYYEKKI